MKKLLFLLLLLGCKPTNHKFQTGDIVVSKLGERGVVTNYYNDWVNVDFKGRSQVATLPESVLTLEVEQ